MQHPAIIPVLSKRPDSDAAIASSNPLLHLTQFFSFSNCLALAVTAPTVAAFWGSFFCNRPVFSYLEAALAITIAHSSPILQILVPPPGAPLSDLRRMGPL